MTHFEKWQPIRIYGQGIQQRVGRHWDCVPAWDVTAIYERPDEQKCHNDKKLHIFWNRHIDRRFHVEYPHASKDKPRVQGHTIGDADKEWQVLTEWRDRCLADAGLTLASPDTEIARCLAEAFAYENVRGKPPCAAIHGRETRHLNHPIEGLLHGSHCVGCATAFMALADACGFPARNIGCGGHWVAEVFVGGKWHMADSIGRHPEHAGLACYLESSYLEALLDPMGYHGERVSEGYREGLWKRPNPQFHLHAGMWGSPCTVRYGANSAFAFYPRVGRWGVKSEDGRRLPLIARSGGFYWPTVCDGDDELLQQVRRSALPMPASGIESARDYFFHPFRLGERLRQSFWLDALDDMVKMEIVFPFGRSTATDFSDATGRQLMVKIGGFEKSLADMDVWPPRTSSGEVTGDASKAVNGCCVVSLPADIFEPNAINWVELCQNSRTTPYIPCLPAVMEPYIAPLWSETGDRFNPPMPTDW